MDFQWYELSKFHFQTSSFLENGMGKRFSRLNHQFMLVDAAQYGGPIALTSDKSQILTLREDDPSIEHVMLYNNDGQQWKRIPIPNPFNNVIVLVNFLLDELVLVLFQKGDYWLVDPFNGREKKFKLIGLGEREIVMEGKVFENGFAFLTNQKKFYFVRNAYQPQAVQFLNCMEQLKVPDISLYWTVFSPKYLISEKVELHLVHPIAGIVQVVENQVKRYFFNHTKDDHVIESKLPNIKGIRFISGLSPNKKLVVYFSAEPLFKESTEQLINTKKKKEKNQGEVQKPIPYSWTYRLIFAPSLTSESVKSQLFKYYEVAFIKENIHLNSKGQPLALKWCGNKAIILQLNNHQMYMYSVDGDYVKIEKQRGDKDKWTYLVEQVDGTRLISRKDNKIIRQIPDAYISIFQSFSEQPGAMLNMAYEAFQDQAPLQDDQLRKDKKKLAIAVDQCVKSARFQIKFQTVSKLMKAATYGKAFLPPNLIANNIIQETVKNLRIVHQLRQNLRFITFQQFSSMSDEMMLKIILRHRWHYLAFEIYNYLKKDQVFRIKIYTDWACCKVENTEDSEEYICEEIRRKLQNQKGISFTQIAHKAIEIGRSDLALRLLEFQPSLAKKVPLLLWIGNQETLEKCYKFYQRGLQDVLHSKDTNLLFLTIRKMLNPQKLSQFEIFEMFSKQREGVYALINYYRLFNEVALVEFYKYLKDTESLIMHYIKRGADDRKYDNNQKLLFVAVELMKSAENQDWRKETVRKLYEHLCQFTKHNPQIKYKTEKIKPVTIMKQLQTFISKADADAVDDMKNEYKISDKRAIMAKIKILINSGKTQELQVFFDKHQKKFNIPAELIADLLFKRKQESWAMRMMARIPSKHKDQQYLLLQRIGRIRQAINLAYDRKEINTLEDIKQTILDAELMGYLNQKLTLLKRKS